jgi:signal transduction histidine kinase/CheY-like chemotaxis protein
MNLRNRQLNWGLRMLPYVGLVILMVSLSRVFVTGWRPLMGLHIFLYLFMLGIVLLSRRLPFHVRAWAVVGVMFILGVSGLLGWGLAGLGFSALFACCILATVLLGTRSGITFATLSSIVMTVVGLLVINGIIRFDFDPADFLRLPVTWIAAICAISFVGGLIVLVLGSLNSEIEGLIDTLKKRNEDLVETIHQLKEEITRRSHIEEERIQLENKLKRAKRMEDLGTLAAGVAHDLNNILVGTVSYPDLLLTRISTDSPLRQPLETIKQSGSKAAAIVHDLLTLARRGVMTSEIVDLNRVIQDYFMSPEHEKLLSFHPNVAITMKLELSLPNLSGSSLHLSKAVMNLVSNAVEAIPASGEIVVSTRWEHVDTRKGSWEEIEEGDYVVLHVSDTGTGIVKEDMGRIFEPFFTKKVMGRSGTGLGMAVVWGTVKDHKGFIDVASTPGKGTAFTLYFPSTKEKSTIQEVSGWTILNSANRESILIVDDVEDQRQITAKILAELGYSVDIVSSGEEAIEFLRKASVDLLILDMCMDPGMDGLDTYRKVLEIRPKQKAIITSGYPETQRVKDMQRLGAGPYIKKPFLINTIATAIRNELACEYRN